MAPQRTNTYKKGLLAETFCVWALRLKGYSILARRFRSPFGEIDIIAKRWSNLIFVEVKARPSLEAALEAVSWQQQKRIEQTALFYVSHIMKEPFQTTRFDVMFVQPRRWPQHILEAWYPEGTD